MQISACRSCGASDLTEVLDLGEQYLSEFRTDKSKPPKHPLRLVVCDVCTLAQLADTAPRAQLFHDSYSFKSGISEAIRNNLHEIVTHARSYILEPKAWLDIASNDGTLLSFVPDTVQRYGVDPLSQFAEEARTHADAIVENFFNPDDFIGETFDVITSVSMFYDLNDPNEFVAGVAKVLAADGVWVIQQNYLPTMVQNIAVDNLSHEHLAYYSMQSLQPLLDRHGLHIMEVMLDPINGGCFRTVVRHKRAGDESLAVWWPDESLTVNDLAAFRVNASQLLGDIRRFVDEVNSSNKVAMFYAASTRGAVLWQAAGLTEDDVPWAVERNADKVGRYFSAVGSLIISEDEMRAVEPDFLLVGPYWLRKNILEREASYLAGGGKMMFPVPRLEVISNEMVSTQ